VESVPVVDVPETVDGTGEHWFGPIRKCPPGDDASIDRCLEKIVRDLTPLVGHGIKEIGLEPLDPILIDTFDYDNQQGPIKFKLLAKDLEVYNLPRYKNLSFHFDNRHSIMHFMYDAPKIRVDTNYKFNGRAFIIPINLSGPIHLDLYGVKAIGTMHLYKTFNDNNETVVQLKDANVDKMTIEEFKVCRLFENNPFLNAFAQSYVHRFGPIAFKALEPRVAKFTGDVIADRLLNPILLKLPYLANYLSYIE